MATNIYEWNYGTLILYSGPEKSSRAGSGAPDSWIVTSTEEQGQDSNSNSLGVVKSINPHEM